MHGSGPSPGTPPSRGSPGESPDAAASAAIRERGGDASPSGASSSAGPSGPGGGGGSSVFDALAGWHQRNINAIQAALDEMMTTTEELADGLPAALEGRKNLRTLREDRRAAAFAMEEARIKLEDADKTAKRADRAVKDNGGSLRAPPELAARRERARQVLLTARVDLATATTAHAKAEKALTKHEVQAARRCLPPEATAVDVLNLFKTWSPKTPEETKRRDALMHRAAVRIQRAHRARTARRRREAARRGRARALAAGAARVVSFLAAACVLLAVLAASSRVFAAVSARGRDVAHRAMDDVWGVARTLAPLEHRYLNDADRADSAAAAEKARAKDALERLAAARRELESAEKAHAVKSKAMEKEMASLRTMAARKAATASNAPMWTRAEARNAGYSGRVAAAATAAASEAMEARLRNATARADAAVAEADAARAELEYLRASTRRGLLPEEGKRCFAAVADARASAAAAAAATAGKAATEKATRATREKLRRVTEAKTRAERARDALSTELDALRAATPELRKLSEREDGDGGSRRKTVLGAAKLVAAAKRAAERAREAAAALRDAESRADAATIELEAFKAVVAGGVGGAGGASKRGAALLDAASVEAEAAREAAERIVADRARALDEARIVAEARADAYKVEIIAMKRSGFGGEFGGVGGVGVGGVGVGTFIAIAACAYALLFGSSGSRPPASSSSTIAVAASTAAPASSDDAASTADADADAEATRVLDARLAPARAATRALLAEGKDARVARDALRALWAAIHLGGPDAQAAFVRERMHEAVYAAMTAHASDAKATEAACGCVLAAASENYEVAKALADNGGRHRVRKAMRASKKMGRKMTFGGAFEELKPWLHRKSLTPVEQARYDEVDGIGPPSEAGDSS
ncbi:uncharacterized protein MICPUCDRAFT_56574 [Micromonas pusilla CCMP1545]|uniref:Predicted protein n=1 Tax=Micromonas pusilla (strain CCMP1545) TaxID=564608 RepID=C1MML3_MICPC|nr:uncharacterized protein MICPUCDRAFT_56574 [Micromonas pusilla CCMP1545]EEH58593.1 predicted protein [Micromonas pusilla CCMP1545]|eukprot:XP_003056948.1 predicted protein [Micromonas pusilla CCMP1545]